jgi:signal transduction histidine kinase
VVRARPGPPALGLRSRIVGAVLGTAVATLIVAAIALLGPLENSLRKAELTTLIQQVPRGSVEPLKSVDPAATLNYRLSPTGRTAALHANGKRTRDLLIRYQRALTARIGASEVALLGFPEPSGHASLLVVWPPDEDLTRSDSFNDVERAFRAHRANYTLGSINGVEYVRAAIPFTTPSSTTKGVQNRWVLAVRKPLAEVSSAVSAVRTAFVVAAVVALALTLMIAIPLSARIVRRLRRLRQAALRLAQEGPAVDVPVDNSRDEVGDLARTFALMQQQLLQQEEARRAFVATASHELRTPLATLDGMLELLHEDLKAGLVDREDAEALLERARAQSRRLGRLAADLLDLSRIDAQIDLRSEPVELGELSRAVLAEFDLGTSERRVVTSLDDGGGSVWALGDPGSVARILRILLDNALRHSPEGGAVTVELRNGSQASLSVTDHGPGVSPEEQELIFERFKRGRETAGQAGFGLGLAIGRELATRMGGELSLVPHDGPGARFTLRLPAARAPEEEPVAVA